MSERDYIIIHSYHPRPGVEALGGFDWGMEGYLAEEEVRAGFAAETNTGHHDFLDRYEHRLLRLAVPVDLTSDQIDAYIEEHYLDQAESGLFDHCPDVLLASLIPALN